MDGAAWRSVRRTAGFAVVSAAIVVAGSIVAGSVVASADVVPTPTPTPTTSLSASPSDSPTPSVSRRPGPLIGTSPSPSPTITAPEVPQASDFSLTSLCKPSPTTGQFRINAKVLGGAYSLAKYGGGAPTFTGQIGAAQTFVTVPWSGSSDTWILTVTQSTFTGSYTKAVGNNLCSAPPEVAPTSADFSLTSLCKPSPTTGQFRINAKVLGGAYSLAKYGGGAPTFTGQIGAAQTFVTVPWSGSSDTWILTVTQSTFTGSYTKAVGNNLCASPSPSPTATPIPTPAPATPTPEPEGSSGPELIPQVPTQVIRLPEEIKSEESEPVVLVPAAVNTNAGVRVSVKVQCTPVATTRSAGTLPVPRGAVMGDVRVCRISLTQKGKVSLDIRYPGTVRVRVTLNAPATSTHTAYHEVVTFLVRGR